MWWSFYESDAHWENFIIRTLAYVSGQSEKAVREMKSSDREDHLWNILDQQPFLLVLDGLERILLAYARMDAAQMLDDDLDEQTANRVAKAHGLPEELGAPEPQLPPFNASKFEPMPDVELNPKYEFWVGPGQTGPVAASRQSAAIFSRRVYLRCRPKRGSCL
ncbi:MAG TPA: hypothetical protein VNT99_01965 [Methylomirabilota bacterium]|nr:hypothetical protein [Methylomirabilota bacterium]